MVIGRRGQATRVRFTRTELAKYIEAGPSEPRWVEPTVDAIVEDLTAATMTLDTTAPAVDTVSVVPPRPLQVDDPLRVFMPE